MKLVFTAIAFALVGPALQAVERPLIIHKESTRFEVEVKGTLLAFTGRLTAYDAEIWVDPNSGKVTKAQVRLSWSGFRSGNTSRDEEVQAWANHDQFPEIVFTLISFMQEDATAARVRGQLMLHGVIKEVTFPVFIVSQDKRLLSIKGETTLNTQDFGWPIARRYGFLKVDPNVQFSFQLQGHITTE